MNQLTANSVLPVVSALPDDEKRALLKELQQMVSGDLNPQKSSERKRTKKENIPWLYTEEGSETLTAKIMNGTFKGI